MNNFIENKKKEFEEKYGSFELCEVINKKDHDRLESFLEKSLSEYGNIMFEKGIAKRNQDLFESSKKMNIYAEHKIQEARESLKKELLEKICEWRYKIHNPNTNCGCERCLGYEEIKSIISNLK